jgi:hypothetical protein
MQRFHRFIVTNFYTFKRNTDRDHQTSMSLVESIVPIGCRYERIGLKGSTLAIALVELDSAVVEISGGILHILTPSKGCDT